MIKKLYTIGLILFLSASLAIAQTNETGKISFAILGGINLQTLTGTDHSGDKLDNDMLIGYHAGINIQIPIASEFYFQPGLLYSLKGAKNTSGSLTSSTRVSYIELPLNLVYKGKLGNGYFMLGLGPYISYGIGGKVTTTGGDASLDTDVAFQNSVELTDPVATTYFTPLDAGGNIFAGYEMAGGLFFQLNTQLGMMKVNPENAWFSDDKASIKHTGYGLSLGYRF
ncbi:MAG: porin family protein [Bacteroidales bacterium]|nr:porin family protein [Bacteroidales bacterium]